MTTPKATKRKGARLKNLYDSKETNEIHGPCLVHYAVIWRWVGTYYLRKIDALTSNLIGTDFLSLL